MGQKQQLESLTCPGRRAQPRTALQRGVCSSKALLTTLTGSIGAEQSPQRPGCTVPRTLPGRDTRGSARTTRAPDDADHRHAHQATSQLSVTPTTTAALIHQTIEPAPYQTAVLCSGVIRRYRAATIRSVVGYASTETSSRPGKG
jgi:hypothetical protein